MIIKSLELMNFRNYDFLDLKFSEGTNILYGDNAQGKTNVLEAIYLSAKTKSHKGSKDKDVISFGQEEAHIRTYLFKEEIGYKVDMHLRKNKSKGIAVDGQKLKKAVKDFFQNLNWYLQKPLCIYRPCSQYPDKILNILGPVYLYMVFDYFFISYDEYMVLFIFGTTE